VVDLLPTTTEKFKKYNGTYLKMIQEHNISDTQLQEILKVFVTYEAFLRHEYHKEGIREKDIESWLEDVKKENVKNIYYKAIGLPSPKNLNFIERSKRWLDGD